MPHIHHPALIPYLPNLLLRALHRDICRIRGTAWGSKCPGAQYVRYHPWSFLVGYHAKVLHEFHVRGFKFAKGWADPFYRGRTVAPWDRDEVTITLLGTAYPEHNDAQYTKSLHRVLNRVNVPHAPKRAPVWTDEDLHRLHCAPTEL